MMHNLLTFAGNATFPHFIINQTTQRLDSYVAYFYTTCGIKSVKVSAEVWKRSRAIGILILHVHNNKVKILFPAMDDKLTCNPNFQNLRREENAEIRFFCEALSLVDSVNNSNIFLGFATQVQESKDGYIKWAQIPDLFPESTKSATYITSIERLYELIDQAVRKGWITRMRTRSLSQIALEAYEYHKNDSKSMLEHREIKPKRNAVKKRKNLADAWKTMSKKLLDLAAYQDKHMNYHADFQKENYLPHPDSWKVYSGTILFIFVALCWTVL